MKWYRRLYLGGDVKENGRELMEKMEKNAGLPGIYVITLAANGSDLLDIFSANYLLQPVLHGLCPMIVGLAKGYDEAVDLACEITLAAWRKNGNFDLSAYLAGRLKPGEELFCEYPMERLKRRSFGFKKKNGG